ncbi:MAG: glycosyltransferase, partial [Janthinobacterium lividum]
SLVPLQWFSMLGIGLSLLSAALFVILMIRRFVIGAEVQGLFTLFAITFFLMGVILFGIGLVGEYVGRIYQLVRGRPRYVVQTVLQEAVDAPRPVAELLHPAAPAARQQ